jgi:hypothetical protein
MDDDNGRDAQQKRREIRVGREEDIASSAGGDRRSEMPDRIPPADADPFKAGIKPPLPRCSRVAAIAMGVVAGRKCNKEFSNYSSPASFDLCRRTGVDADRQGTHNRWARRG